MASKGKAVPLHAMKALVGRGDITPTHSRPRHYMGVSGQRHAPAALLPPGKGSTVPIVIMTSTDTFKQELRYLDGRATEVRSSAQAKVFPSASASRPALKPTQPPVQ
jgi:hypothetical protein